MNLVKDNWLGLYKQLSGSDFKGNIQQTQIIEMLYAILCVDLKAYECKITMPDIAFPVVARELLELYQTYRDNFIDGEDYSYLSMETVADAFMIYLRDTKIDIKVVHSMSRYDLASEVIKHLNNI